MSDWIETTLGVLAEEVRDRTHPQDAVHAAYIGLEHMDPGAARVSQAGVAGDVDSTKSVFRSGDTLFGKLRPYLHKVALADLEGICSTDILVFRTRDAGVAEERFIYHVLSSERAIRYAVGRSAGTRMPRISAEQMLALPVALPPLDEQSHICDVLDAADEAHRAADRHYGALLRMRLVLRRAAFAELADEPSAPLSELGSFARGGSFPRHEQGRSEGDHPVFKVSDMNPPGNERQLRVPENWVTEEQRQRLKMKLWPAGTVVFARVGAALTGDRRRLLVGPSILDDNMLGLVPDEKRLSPYFLMLALEGVPLARMAQQGAVPSVNARMVGAVTIPVPPVDRQYIIEARFRALDRMLEKARLRVDALNAVRRALSVQLLLPDEAAPEAMSLASAGA